MTEWYKRRGLLPKKEVLKDIKKEVEKVLLQRDENGVLKDETDYICGAMVVVNAITKAFDSDEDSMKDVPVMWQIYPMTGRSIIEELRGRSNNDSSRYRGLY